MRTNSNQRKQEVGHVALHRHEECLAREEGYRNAWSGWNRKYRRRTVAAVLSLVLMAGIVTAQVVGPMLFSPSTSLSLVTLAFPSAGASDAVDPTVGVGAKDFFNLTATYSGTGSLAGVYLKIRIQVSPFSPLTWLKCKDGNITVAERTGTSGPYTAVGAGPGECAAGTNDLVLANILLTQTVSGTPVTYGFWYSWIGVAPLDGSGTFPVKIVIEPNT